MLIELSQCLFGYGARAVVRVAQLRLHEAQCLGVFGPNGSGKTTLVRGLTGLLPPLAGAIHRRSALRYGYLPQHRAMELHWPMTGLDAASLAVSAHCPFGWLRRQKHRLPPVMRTLGVEELAHQPFARLSGGQQQRLLLAGALAADPQLLVLDEPTDGLDIRSREVLLRTLHGARAHGLCTVIISHDVEDLLQLCQQIAWLHPAGDAEQPGWVEIIEPRQLAQRVLEARDSS